MKSLNNVLKIVVTARKCLDDMKPIELPSELVESPLSMLKDVATLIHQYTTKLSVAAKPPITRDALEKYANDMATTITPLIAAVQVFNAEKYGEIIQNRLKMYAERVLFGIEALLRSVSPKPLGYISEDWKTRGRLIDTGILWESCEKIEKLGSEGIVGYMLEEWDNFVSMLEDARSDLEDYKEGDDSNWDDFGSESEDDSKEAHSEEVFRSEEQIQLANSLLQKLNACKILFLSIKKRRIKNEYPNTFLGELFNAAKQTSDSIDDIVAQVQEDDENFENELDNFHRSARNLCKICISSAQEDSFTPWFSKWLENWEIVSQK